MRVNPRVREQMKHNRRTVINNTTVTEVRKELVQELYKVMDRNKATESHINFIHENYLEVDLFATDGQCIAWAVPVYSKKEN